MWEDLVDEQMPIDIVLVNPAPPLLVRPGTVATVIVHQHLAQFKSACLTTALIPADPDLRLLESAHSIADESAFHDLLRLAGVADICRLRHEQGFGACTLHVGWQIIAPDAPIPFHHGLGLTIRVPIPVGDVDAPIDGSSLMARRPVPRRPLSSSTTPSTSSSSSSTPDWRQTVIFTLDGRSTSSSLPWHDNDALLVHAALSVDLPQSQVLCMHGVPHRPTDFIQMDLQGLLLQRSNEFRPSPFVRIVLLDLELHVANDAQATPFQRRARWLPFATTRQTLFRTLDLAAIHREHPADCRLWHNHVLIANQDEIPLHLADGDYIRIFVGETDMQETCSSADDEIVDIDSHSATNSSDLESWQDQDDSNMLQHLPHSALFQRAVEIFSAHVHRFDLHVCKTDPSDHPASDQPPCQRESCRTPWARIDTEWCSYQSFCSQSFTTTPTHCGACQPH